MGRRGETTSYVPMTFDEYYAKKLEALKVRLKDIIYGATPFVVSQEYACKKCAGRLKLHTDGRMTCLMCQPLPAIWSKQQQERVYEILRNYPDVDECAQEWKPNRPPSRIITTEAVAYGARMEEARLSRGWKPDDLAMQVIKRDGSNISKATVNMVEKGHQNLGQYVKQQIDHILACNICKPGTRCEELESILGLEREGITV